MSEKSEMELYFEENIAEARLYLDAAELELKKWEKAYQAWKLAVELGEIHRRKPPKRQSVATLIKDAIFSFPGDQQFTAKDVFVAMGQENLDYTKTRLSISAWLQHFVEKEQLEKVDRGIYKQLLPKKLTRRR